MIKLKIPFNYKGVLFKPDDILSGLPENVEKNMIENGVAETHIAVAETAGNQQDIIQNENTETPDGDNQQEFDPQNENSEVSETPEHPLTAKDKKEEKTRVTK